MAEFINFFKSGQVGNTNLTDIFTKTIPDGFVSIGFPALPPLQKISIPPPPTINIDKGTKDFFTTGRTDALDKSNSAIAKGFTDIKVDNDFKTFLETGRTDALDKSNTAVKVFFENDVKNVATTVGKGLEQMMTAPSKLISSLADSLNNPILLPAILVIGGIVVLKIATK